MTVMNCQLTTSDSSVPDETNTHYTQMLQHQ